MNKLVSALDRSPITWLLLGVGIIALTYVQSPIALLAWLAAVPFLRYQRLRPGWRGLVSLVLALLVGWTLATVRIVSDPLPLVMSLLYGVPLAFFAALPYLALSRLRLDPIRRILVFALLATAAEWLQRNGTPFLSWGAAGYSQMSNLPLMQLASLGGLSFISLLIHGVGATIEALLAGESRARRPAVALGAIVVLAHVWGGLRLQTPPAETTLVATIDTPSTIGSPDLPEPALVADWNETLAARTRRAADAGARLVVWTEASTLVMQDEEDAFQAWLGDLAAETATELVVAYVIPLPGDSFRYENKYAWLRPDGTVDHTYLKHEPVPGEPAVRGTEPPTTVETAFGRAGGAICYDYDAPYLAVNHARLGADLVALPSSDWAGIDPVHTHMAAVRAIEGGHSVVRSTRWGLSAGIDPMGRLLGQRSAFDDTEDGVLLVRLPRHGRQTLFGTLGERGVGLILLLALIATGISARYARHLAPHGSHDRSPRPAGGLHRPRTGPERAA
ncbi:MAG: hypothetical protein KDA24_08290 [Deltaproteobacteria bacterium]|nr:hypothetical protein [Deltaproteobacteria bacterium]